MSQLNLKIGPKIKAFRRQLGLQANKLAEDLNISPSYLNLIEGGKRKIDGDLLLKICEKLNIELSQLTSKSDINLENTLSEILDDKLFEDLDILGPEVKDLVGTNPKIGRAIVRLGDILKKKDHEMINKIETISGKIVDNRKNSFPGEVISDFLQDNKNYFPKLEDFANDVFEKVQKNNRTRYIALCDYLKSEYDKRHHILESLFLIMIIFLIYFQPYPLLKNEMVSLVILDLVNMLLYGQFVQKLLQMYFVKVQDRIYFSYILCEKVCMALKLLHHNNLIKRPV